MGCCFPLAQGEQEAAAQKSPGHGGAVLAGPEHPSFIPFFPAISDFSTGLRKSVDFLPFIFVHENATELSVCGCDVGISFSLPGGEPCLKKQAGKYRQGRTTA